MPHRLGLGGDIEHAHGHVDVMLLQHLLQACDRTRAVASRAGFEQHNGIRLPRRLQPCARAKPKSQSGNHTVLEDVHRRG